MEKLDAIKILMNVPMQLRQPASIELNRATKSLIDISVPDEVDSCGRTALHYAAMHNHPAIVAHLLHRGASDTHIDMFSLTPFVLAWAHGHVACACLLAMANPHIVTFTDPFWSSSNPTRCDDPHKKQLMALVLDKMRAGINIWDWVLDSMENARVAHAALGHYPEKEDALLQQYAFADPVREAILLCLVPATRCERALIRELHALLAPFCDAPRKRRRF